MPQAKQKSVRLLRLLLGASILLPLALFILLAWQAWDRIERAADDRLERSLAVLAEQAARTFQAVDLAFVLAERTLRGLSDDEILGREADINGELKEIVKAVPSLEAVWVIDASGRVIASSKLFPIPKAGPVAADRTYFKVQRDRDAGLFIGEVIEPRLARESAPFVPISKRRVGPGGRFDGVIQISLLPKGISEFYATLARGRPDSTFALIRRDGDLLAWYPVLAAAPARLGEGSAFQSMLRKNPEGGFYTATSPFDGTERRIGVHKVGSLPLYVSAGLALPALRRAWGHEVGRILLFGLPPVLVVCLLVWAVMRRTTQLYAALERQQEAEEALRQAQKMEAIGQLSGGIAHDFNNMLAIIISGIDLALRRLRRGDTDIVRFLDGALDGANRGAALTKRLLSFARRSHLEPAVLDINEVVKNMAELLHRTLGEKVELETVLGAGLWRTKVDPGQIESAILNLCVNARDAMPKGGKLTIETSNAALDEDYAAQHGDLRAGQYVLVAVTDTGFGIPAEVLPRVFEPFFTTKQAGHGTGLGLSQVYGFIKQSEGHVKIYSELGHGTTVKLYLPRDTSGQRPAAPASADATMPVGRAEKVLVVEDEPGVREMSVSALRELGYQVIEAASAEEALLMLKPDEPIDLLFTDVVMPGKSGRQLADELRAGRPGLKAIFTTGYTRNAIVHNGVVDEGVELLLKPFTVAQLARRVREVLGPK